jgi:sporulation integral membrane protein YlbJ
MNTPNSHRAPRRPHGYAATVLFAATAILLVTGIVAFPEQAFQASLRGLTIWWDIVFPAMLPFLILSELMIAFGVTHFLGVWLEPLMRAALRLPGAGGWALSMALAAGYPAGARTAAALREKGWITREEGERLLAYCFLCSPVFVVSVVATGFFRNASLGWVLFGLHIAAWIPAALVFRLIAPRSARPARRAARPDPPRAGSLLARSLSAMADARAEDGRSLGKLLGDAVTQSVQTMLMIGGSIMLFAVLLKIAELSGALPVLSEALRLLCAALGWPEPIVPPLVAGILEVHLGVQAAGDAAVPPAWQAAVAGAAMAWGGWAAHAQVKGLAARTDLSLKPYLLFRALHGIAAFGLTLTLWQPLVLQFGGAAPSLGAAAPGAPGDAAPNLWLSWPEAAWWGGTALLLLAAGAFVLRIIRPSESA